MRAPRDTPPSAGRDLSQRARAEEKLRRSEEAFRSVFEHAPIGILLLGPDLRVQRANRALCAMLGYSEDELLGRVATELIHPEDHAESNRMRDRVLAGDVDELAVERIATDTSSGCKCGAACSGRRRARSTSSSPSSSM